MEKKKLQVVVRVRPKQTDDNLWVRVAGRRALRTINHRNIDETLEFEFEQVFGPDSTQQEVYSDAVRPLLSRVLEGQNASVFAYGPTGSGKTFTILGDADHPGVIPRVVKDLFSDLDNAEHASSTSECMTKTTPRWTHQVSYSYLEIYNEKIQDLLDPMSTDCVIREDRLHNIHVSGLSEKSISTVDEFNASFAPASRNRTTASTRLNPHSSRSHSILLLKVTKTLESKETAVQRKLTGKMYIIDLAGSEDNRRTGNIGIRLKESGAINTSLFMLSEVVEALNKQRTVIPYRQSKLTRLLQDSLGGSAHSCMIVNVSPEEQHYLDTVSTLKLARKSKKIVNTIVVHEENTAPPQTAITRLNQQPVSVMDGNKVGVENQLLQTRVAPPLLSPLIRRQQRFECKIKEDFDALETRIIKKLSKRQPQFEPDSTVCDDKNTQSVEDRLLHAQTGLLRMKTSALASSSESTVMNDFDSLLESPMVLPVKRKGMKTSVCSSSSKSSVMKDFDSLLEIPVKKKRRALMSMNTTSLHVTLDSQSSVFISPKSNESFKTPFNPCIDEEHCRGILHVLNDGSLKEIQKLNSIGAKKANLIYEFRQRNGAFLKISDLVRVPGFSAATLRNFCKMNFIDEALCLS